VARLQAIPERPAQELAVALAGPAVNLIIAALLIMVVGPELVAADLAAVVRPQDILPALAAINLFLALFNLLPAFPMDGGRALRAVLAIFLERGKATRIAARVGQGFAVGFGFLGVLSGNFVLILIALFVFFAASAEAQEAQLHRLAAGLRVADAMVTGLLSLSTSDNLEDAARLLLHTGQRDFPVVDEQAAWPASSRTRG
jgi:stage IV sporulation protein FB